MKEVEIKLQINNPEEIIKMLEAKGCTFSSVLAQHDIIYIPKDENDLPVKLGTNVLRIRTQDGKHIFTLKQGKYLVKTEKELEIKDPETMKEIIDLLGFHEISQVKKQRRTCHVEDFEICIDHVEGLGDYLEMEKITAEDPGPVQEYMLSYLKDLGIDTTKQINVGYDVINFQNSKK